jgi:hypothetical protein
MGFVMISTRETSSTKKDFTPALSSEPAHPPPARDPRPSPLALSFWPFRYFRRGLREGVSAAINHDLSL